MKNREKKHHTPLYRGGNGKVKKGCEDLQSFLPFLPFLPRKLYFFDNGVFVDKIRFLFFCAFINYRQ